MCFWSFDFHISKVFKISSGLRVGCPHVPFAQSQNKKSGGDYH